MSPAQTSARAAASAYRPDPMDRISRFMPLVRRLAWHMHGAGQADLDIEDLVQTGLVALTECVARHEHDSEDGFAAYAKMRVKGAMIDLLRRNATITRGAMARRREINATEKRLLTCFGRPPTSTELAEALGVSEDELEAARLAATPLRFEPLEECYSDSDSAFVDETPNGLDMLCDVEARVHLADAIHALGERSQLVVQLYFLEELNLSEIAQILGVSVPRVHQLKANALSELKKLLGEVEIDFVLAGGVG
jgi:RNA polymerase sigma factor for flagellar operon FliA